MEKRCIGWHAAGRTNRWEITCDCGKKFIPFTTRLATQQVTCPKCGKSEVMDYNAD